ncbi:organic cation transporter protein-like isoform X2 [Physella acuta]|nr:organic cation transporter protein-like isoform X2 [Physella acuta]
MLFDDVIKHVGEFGLYQKRVYFLLCLVTISHGMAMVVLVYLMYTPRHRCAIPGYPNDTYHVTSPEHEQARNQWIPPDDSCSVYSTISSTTNSTITITINTTTIGMNATTVKCDSWVFDQSVFYNTAVSQFNLVCDSEHQASHAVMIFYGGFLIGTLVMGAVSDIIGRKLSMFVAIALATITGTGLAFVNNFVGFLILNFFVGSTVAGILPSAILIGVELVGPSKRTITAILTSMCVACGVLSVAGLGFLTRSWTHLLLAVTLPKLACFLMWWFVPESPRWQIQKGQYAKARHTLAHAARVNGNKVPESVLDEVMPLEHRHDKLLVNVVKGNSSYTKTSKDEKVQSRFLDVFKSPALLLRVFFIFFNWFVSGLAYFGLNYNIGNLGAGSIFLNFFLSGLVEFPGYLFTVLAADRIGRKMCHFLLMFVCGVACLCSVLSIVFAPADLQWITVMFAMIGKLGAAGVMGTVYMYSIEVFPTSLRNSAIGVCSCWARVGSMLAPYMAAQGARTVGVLGSSVPLLVCGCLALAASFMFFVLPETMNQKLPETIGDMMELIRKPKCAHKDNLMKVEIDVASPALLDNVS